MPDGWAAARTAAEHAHLVVRGDANLFQVAELALDNGVGSVLVVDAAGKLLGEASLDGVRAEVRAGGHLVNRTAADVATASGQKAGRLRAEVDETGRLIDAHVDHAAEFIPVAEPLLSHREFRNLMDAFLSTWISSTGEYLRTFERTFAASHGMAEGVAVSNGTVSLHLAMTALGIGPGDEVIVPDLTFAASINTIVMCGATPVIVDVDPDTWALTPEGIEQAVTPRTRAVMPVHVFGRPAPMTEIAAVARRHGLFIIEDCAEAHGARYDGKFVGQFSDIASFSFFANKIVTSGEGGMCLTDDPILAERMRILRDHGMRPERRYWHEEIGFNYRMTNLQAAVGCAQVERLPELLQIRSKVQEAYNRAFADIADVRPPSQLSSRFEPVAWFACATVPANRRAELIAACKAQNIDLRPFFNGLSMMPAYKRWARPCPVSRELSQTGVNLPTSHRIDAEVTARIAGVFRSVLGSR